MINQLKSKFPILAYLEIHTSIRKDNRLHRGVSNVVPQLTHDLLDLLRQQPALNGNFFTIAIRTIKCYCSLINVITLMLNVQLIYPSLKQANFRASNTFDLV